MKMWIMNDVEDERKNVGRKRDERKNVERLKRKRGEWKCLVPESAITFTFYLFV